MNGYLRGDVGAGRWPFPDGGQSAAAPVTRLWVALLLAVVFGPVTDAAFPDRGVWPLAFVGVACLLVALLGRGFWSGCLVGFVAGVSFYLVHISWAALYLGPVPWVALSVLQAVIFAVGAGLIAAVFTRVGSVWPTVTGRLLLVPVTVAGVWLGREEVAGAWPYGGFAWGRLALSQATSPFTELVSWVGVPGLSFLVAAVSALGVQLARERAVPWGKVTGAGAVLLVLGSVPVWAPAPSGVARVLAVQGNGPAGYFSARQPGDLLQAQVQATWAAGQADADLVVWPENAMDEDPFRSSRAAAMLDTVSRELGAPVVFGAITERQGRFYNSSVLWQAGRAATDVYDKKHPVPFGEYVPDRWFWEPLAPDLIGLIQREYQPGSRDGVFQVEDFRVGTAICFDVTDDRVMRELVDGGAELLLVQSNNADFGRTDESVQQEAVARLRAVESGRTVVNISTVGVSSVIAADGSTVAALPAHRAGAMAVEVPLGSGLSPAIRWGDTLAGGGVLGAAASLAVAAVLSRNRGLRAAVTLPADTGRTAGVLMDSRR